jgi:hypothetical protein
MVDLVAQEEFEAALTEFEYWKDYAGDEINIPRSVSDWN